MNTFTSESVTEGHPDKVADQISDAILDAFIKEDPYSRVAVETLVTSGLVVVAGEVSSKGEVDVRETVLNTIREIGYNDIAYGMDYRCVGILTSLHAQSPDIALGVVEKEGAGDQGMMFGFATDEGPEFMPMPIYLAHRLVERLAYVRKNGILPFLGPDGKSQVTLVYDDNGKPVKASSVVISAQHTENVSEEDLKEAVIEEVVKKVIPSELLDGSEIFVNPTGRFVVGGPAADTGLTGRKIIVDTYGGAARHGGGCFSGKDPTKVDRSAAYMARYVAKNLVAAGVASKVEVRVAYAIGVSKPLMVAVETFGTGKVPDSVIEEKILKLFDFTPSAIIDRLKLRRPIYQKTAAYGHFGRNDPDFTWELTDSVELIKSEFAF